MGFLNQISGILQHYVGAPGPADPHQVYHDYDQIVEAVPADIMGSVIGPALESLDPSEVERQVINATAALSPQQRGSFLRSLIDGYRSSKIDPIPLLSELGLDQSLATNPDLATPENLALLIRYAQQNSPRVFHYAMAFFGDYPELVKIMGPAAITAIARRLGQRHGLG